MRLDLILFYVLIQISWNNQLFRYTVIVLSVDIFSLAFLNLKFVLFFQQKLHTILSWICSRLNGIVKVESNAITQVQSASILFFFILFLVYVSPHLPWTPRNLPPLYIVVPTYTSASTNCSINQILLTLGSIHSLCPLFPPSLKSINCSMIWSTNID